MTSDLTIAQQSVLNHLPWKNGRRSAGDIFACIFINEKFCILIKNSQKFVPRGPIDNSSHWFR